MELNGQEGSPQKSVTPLRLRSDDLRDPSVLYVGGCWCICFSSALLPQCTQKVLFKLLLACNFIVSSLLPKQVLSFGAMHSWHHRFVTRSNF